jgi:hypothetical protein
MRVTVNHVAGASFPSIRLSSRRSGRAPVHLLAVDVPAAASGGAQRLELRVKGLPVGRDAGMADQPFFGVSFRSYLTANVTP